MLISKNRIDYANRIGHFLVPIWQARALVPSCAGTSIIHEYCREAAKRNILLPTLFSCHTDAELGMIKPAESWKEVEGLPRSMTRAIWPDFDEIAYLKCQFDKISRFVIDIAVTDPLR